MALAAHLSLAPCEVRRCKRQSPAVAHRDPILWRLCEDHQARGARVLKDLPGLNRHELLEEIGGDGRWWGQGA